MQRLWGPLGIALGVLGAAGGCGTGGSDSGAVGQNLSPADSLLAAIEARILANPNDPAVYLERAEWQMAQGKPARAMEDLDLSLRADSTFAPAWELKSQLFYESSNFEACIAALDDCIRLAPNSTACLERRAEMAIHLKQYEQAFGYLNAALKINDQLHECYWMKGRIYEETGADEKALSSYQTAVEVKPDFYEGFVSLGLFCAQQKNPLAEEYYRSALELKPRFVEARYNLAMYLQESGQYPEALQAYKEILDIDPNNASAAFNQGFIFLEYLQTYDSAAHWFSEAIRLLPHYYQAHYNRGLAHESMGRKNEALQDYNEALRYEPTFTAAALAKSRVLGE
ncbi:MAG: hypothetical protein RJA19_688 [Bacteroidota bacterium]|jgi:tetratricopeptide (TPR) repeat protein